MIIFTYTDEQKKVYTRIFQVIHVINKHELYELIMTRMLSKASGLFEFINLCLSGMLAYT